MRRPKRRQIAPGEPEHVCRTWRVIIARLNGVYGGMKARGRVVAGFAFGLGLCVSAVMAQTAGPAAAGAAPGSLAVGNRMYDAGKELARMAKRYSLTSEQKAKIQPILVEQQRQVHALGEDASLSDTAWAAGVRKVHAETVAKVKLQLTDAQASKYAKDEAKRARSDSDSDDEDGPPDGPPPGPPPDGGPGGGGPPPV